MISVRLNGGMKAALAIGVPVVVTGLTYAGVKSERFHDVAVGSHVALQLAIPVSLLAMLKGPTHMRPAATVGMLMVTMSAMAGVFAVHAAWDTTDKAYCGYLLCNDHAQERHDAPAVYLPGHNPLD